MQQQVQPLGESLSIKTTMLDMGAAMTQKFAPLKSICNYLYGAHFYNGDMSRQVQAHHFCSHLNEDIQQCLIYESNQSNAKLIGIEYVITEKLFKTLSEEEKAFWHSHVYEVKSGYLVAPNLPNVAEHELMESLIKTYGKTIHTWQVDRGDQLPIGPPQLMMAFTADGQMKPELIKIRDELCFTSLDQSKKIREDIVPIVVDPAADQWKTKKCLQLEPKVCEMKI